MCHSPITELMVSLSHASCQLSSTKRKTHITERGSGFLARDQPHLLQTPSKSLYQQPPNTTLHSLALYLLNYVLILLLHKVLRNDEVLEYLICVSYRIWMELQAEGLKYRLLRAKLINNV